LETEDYGFLDSSGFWYNLNNGKVRASQEKCVAELEDYRREFKNETIMVARHELGCRNLTKTRCCQEEINE